MPTTKEMFSSIPRGNTCRGVHQAIIKFFIDQNLQENKKKSVLDIPCGNGDLMQSLKNFFPSISIKGCDIKKPFHIDKDDFSFADLNQKMNIFPGNKFDYITSVSGVMEFDNTFQFFLGCKELLKENGVFLVTNDNLRGIRDRILYLLLGRFKQYDLFSTISEPTWKIIPINNLVRILESSGFKILKIQYLSVRWNDWILLPIALLLYPIEYLYIQLSKTKQSLITRRQMYPFKSMIYRHYIIFCQKI